jgi:hypothetical protein
LGGCAIVSSLPKFHAIVNIEGVTLGQIVCAIEAADAAKADVLAKLAVLKTEVARIEGMSDDRFLLLEDRVLTLENGKQPPPKAEYGADRYEWEGLMLVHQTPEKGDCRYVRLFNFGRTSRKDHPLCAVPHGGLAGAVRH